MTNVRGFGCRGFRSTSTRETEGDAIRRGKFCLLPSRLFYGIRGRTEAGRGLGRALRSMFQGFRGSTGNARDRSDISKLFSGFSIGDGFLKSAIPRQGTLLTGLLSAVTSLPVNRFKSRIVSAFKSTCRCLVFVCTSGSKGGNKRFCAPRRMSRLLAGVILRNGARIGGICSPYYNDNSLLLGFTGVLNGSGIQRNFCKRRVIRAACGLYQVGVFLRGVGCSEFGVTGNSALGSPVR